MKVFVFFALPVVFCLSLPASYTACASQLSGIVIDINGNPVGNAVVRLQGTSFSTLSDQKGRFILAADDAAGSKNITAWESGFYNGGNPVSKGDKEYRIVLKPLVSGDNLHYKWLSPFQKHTSGPTDVKANETACEICHPVIIEEWRKSSHAASASNPFFLAFYNGTGAKGDKAAAPGYRLDFPNSNGNCSSCHIPAAAIGNPFHADPNKATGVAGEGIFCDFCHKIEATSVDTSGGYPGILSINLRRPVDGHQIFYGPYDDVIAGEDSYHALYKTSTYCAPCHSGRFWNVLAYSEFQEWAESDYAKKNISCQDCHMRSNGKTVRFALEEKGSIARDPLAIPSHANYGIRDKEFMAKAIQLETHADIEKQAIKVSVTIRNTNAGHCYPTGNPMRNLILLVEARDEKGNSLPMVAGETVPVWGGVGAVEKGNYAGLPGKGFAKVLRDLTAYPADGNQEKHFKRSYPAPHWRPAFIESDNRIAANGSDRSTYSFALPKSRSGQIRVTARLIYRKGYKTWVDAKGLEIPDMEIARGNILLRG